MSCRDISLAKYRTTTSAEARERARLAMAAHDEALAQLKPTKAKRLTARQSRLPFHRTARADFAMHDHNEAVMNRKEK